MDMIHDRYFYIDSDNKVKPCYINTEHEDGRVDYYRQVIDSNGNSFIEIIFGANLKTYKTKKEAEYDARL